MVPREGFSPLRLPISFAISEPCVGFLESKCMIRNCSIPFMLQQAGAQHVSLGHEEAFKNFHHLKFQHVWLPGQKFSGRKGIWVGYHADAVLDKAVNLAL